MQLGESPRSWRCPCQGSLKRGYPPNPTAASSGHLSSPSYCFFVFNLFVHIFSSLHLPEDGEDYMRLKEGQ
ncbi:hypothetical protein AAFF_G00090440 [Aldrovandia affinis]|uniref:Uncharacterized protein n=1 Tax=Aldrovandia affinis TaxID=143900 RepID=A0AAD7RW67_9TELE|nr:hypothetical protein AAFF_G00090440 [Aldrovandia affinis]